MYTKTKAPGTLAGAEGSITKCKNPTTKYTALGKAVPPLPERDGTRGCLTVSGPWYQIPKADRYWCSPCCAGCGRHIIAAGSGHYTYWADDRPRGSFLETVFFDLCRQCATALQRGADEGTRLHSALKVSGFMAACKQSWDNHWRNEREYRNATVWRTAHPVDGVSK